MRYTCFRTSVSKVFDRILDEDESQSIVESLKSKEMTCSIQIKNGPVHESVRILSSDDDSITWRLMKNGSSLIKNSAIEDIVAITVYSNEELTIALKSEPTRGSTIDASDS